MTGVVTQPIKGAKKEGAAGFLKGMGKGFAGLIVKPAAGKSLIVTILGVTELTTIRYLRYSRICLPWNLGGD